MRSTDRSWPHRSEAGRFLCTTGAGGLCTLDRAGLQFDHLAILAVGGHQRLVCADFHDAARIEHDDSVRVGDRTESVSDNKAGAIMRQQGQARLDHALAFGVQVARRLVHDQDGWIGHNGSCDRQSLPLAATELHSSLTDQRFVPIRQFRNEFGRVGNLCCTANVFLGRIAAAVADALGHGSIKQKDILLYDTDQTTVALQVDFAQIAAVQ